MAFLLPQFPTKFLLPQFPICEASGLILKAVEESTPSSRPSSCPSYPPLQPAGPGQGEAGSSAKHAPVTFPLPPLPCQDCEEEKVMPRQFNETVVLVIAGLSLYLV